MGVQCGVGACFVCAYWRVNSSLTLRIWKRVGSKEQSEVYREKQRDKIIRFELKLITGLVSIFGGCGGSN